MLSLAAKEWMKQGRAEGWQEGQADHAARSILAVLKARFGQVPPDVEPWVRQLTTEQLNSLLQKAATTPSLDAFLDTEHRH